VRSKKSETETPIFNVPPQAEEIKQLRQLKEPVKDRMDYSEWLQELDKRMKEPFRIKSEVWESEK